jgi:hypothetical protein
MSTTYTANIGLGEPAIGDTGWGTTLNTDLTLLDSQAPIGGLGVQTTEVPSASLNVKVAAGGYVKQDGTIGTYAGTSSQAIPSSSTKVLYLDLTSSGALTIAASYPATAHVRIATVVTSTSTVSSITDNRQCFPVCGSVLDGVQITVGTATGLMIGSASSQKLGFFGHAPAVQPTMGAATAGSSYTSNEQVMLNAVYSAIRALGLGS